MCGNMKNRLSLWRKLAYFYTSKDSHPMDLILSHIGQHHPVKCINQTYASISSEFNGDFSDRCWSQLTSRSAIVSKRIPSLVMSTPENPLIFTSSIKVGDVYRAANCLSYSVELGLEKSHLENQIINKIDNAYGANVQPVLPHKKIKTSYFC